MRQRHVKHCIWSTKQTIKPWKEDLSNPSAPCSLKLVPLPALLTSVNGTTIFPNTQRTSESFSSPTSLNQWPSSLDSTAFHLSRLSTLMAATCPQGPPGLLPGLLQLSPNLLLPTKLPLNPYFVSTQILSSNWIRLPAQKGFNDSPITI